MKKNIQIKTILGNVLFEYEKENNTIKETLEQAIKNGVDLNSADLRDADLRDADLCDAILRDAILRDADLRGADLYGANLRGADLYGADLYGAYLRGANLRGVDLGGANLRGADLGGAELVDADLGGAYLRGANLVDADLGDWGKLKSSNDILIIGTIGSRNDYTTLFHTDKGVFVKCGCFSGTLNEFEIKVKETHHGNEHERDYLALIEFAKIKFEL